MDIHISGKLIMLCILKQFRATFCKRRSTSCTQNNHTKHFQ